MGEAKFQDLLVQLVNNLVDKAKSQKRPIEVQASCGESADTGH